MPEILYKLRNGLTVKAVRNVRNRFIIVTKNKEIFRQLTRGQVEMGGFRCGSTVQLISDPHATTRLACRGGAYGRDFDVVGYKRRPKIDF